MAEQQLEAVAKEITAAKDMLQKVPDDKKGTVLEYLTQLQKEEVMLMERQQPAITPADLTNYLGLPAGQELWRQEYITGYRVLGEIMKHKLDLDEELLEPGDEVPNTVLPLLREGTSMRHCYRVALATINAAPDQDYVITGNPGIGKSKFALPLITWLAKWGKRVLYQFNFEPVGEAYVYWDFSKEDVKVDFCSARLGAASRLGYNDDADLYRIYDGEPPAKPFQGQGHLIVLTSPEHLKKKFIMQGNFMMLYFGVWRVRELERLRQQFFPDMTVAELHQRITWFGPIPRTIFKQRNYTLDQLDKEFFGAATDFTAALKLLSPRSDYSSRLVHLMASSHLRFKGYRLASPAIASLLAEWFWTNRRRKMTAFITAGRVLQVAGFPGIMFEHLGHRAFHKQTVTLSMRLLTTSGKPIKRPPSAELRSSARANRANAAVPAEPALPADTAQPVDTTEANSEVSEDEGHHAVTERQQVVPAAASEQLQQQPVGQLRPKFKLLKVLQRLQLAFSGGASKASGAVVKLKLGPAARVYDHPGLDLKSLAPGSYLQPEISGNAAWDAVYFGNADVYIMQYTVSMKHGVKAQPLSRLLLRLGTDLTSKAKLLFVVPIYAAGQDDLVATFPQQPYTGSRDEVLKSVPASVKQLPQYVAGLPVFSGGRPVASSGSGS